MKVKLTGIFMLLSIISYSLEVEMVDLKTGKKIGTVEVNETKYGLEFKPKLKNLPLGLHGFHIHENGDIKPSEKDGKRILGGKAGGHYDPFNTKKHGLPWNDDVHKGDLPPLYVNSSGVAEQPVLAPRLKMEEIKGRSIMIHQHGDNHSDHPAPLGGGGSRIAAGIIPL